MRPPRFPVLALLVALGVRRWQGNRDEEELVSSIEDGVDKLDSMVENSQHQLASEKTGSSLGDAHKQNSSLIQASVSTDQSQSLEAQEQATGHYHRKKHRKKGHRRHGGGEYEEREHEDEYEDSKEDTRHTRRHHKRKKARHGHRREDDDGLPVLPEMPPLPGIGKSQLPDQSANDETTAAVAGPAPSEPDVAPAEETATVDKRPSSPSERSEGQAAPAPGKSDEAAGEAASLATGHVSTAPGRGITFWLLLFVGCILFTRYAAPNLPQLWRYGKSKAGSGLKFAYGVFKKSFWPCSRAQRDK